MQLFSRVRSRFSFMKRYHYRWALLISIGWTIIDLIWIRFFHFSPTPNSKNPFDFVPTDAFVLRAAIVFTMSSVMGYMLLFKLRQWFRDLSLLLNLLCKTGILLIASMFLNFLLHFTFSVFILDLSWSQALYNFF